MEYNDGVDAALTLEEIGRLRLALLRVARRIRSQSVGDVSPSQFAVLTSLARHGASTIGQIAEYEHVQPPSASRIVAALDQRGLVGRSADPDDRRCAKIALTPAGEEYLSEVRAASTSWLAAQVDGLPAADVKRLGAAIPVLERILEDTG